MAPQPFQCTWEGSSIISYKFGAQQVTLIGLYFFRIAPQGVAALVSVSDGKIKITILILRRGALSNRNWYRGEVLATDLEGENLLAHVCFVDYGTDQWCEASHELRKELFMKEQPVQALPIVLQGVLPRDGVWMEAELNFLHETLVDKVLEVEVEHLDLMPLQGKVTCDGSDVGEILHQTFLD